MNTIFQLNTLSFVPLQLAIFLFSYAPRVVVRTSRSYHPYLYALRNVFHQMIEIWTDHENRDF